ncbi:metal ABC transporter permease [Candidatus Bathyarchaeota archaeon]|nr:MAG: metal ABC transporter permease [Candidatus Bathyarchaeota archaeon]
MTDALVFGLIVGALVGLAAGYVGSLMVLKKMALVGDALSHVALPGLALGILFNFNPFLGAFAALFLSAVVTWYLERRTKLSAEALVGILFVFALAIGILITPQVDLLEALFGDVTKTSLIDAVGAVAVSAVVLFLTRRIYPKLVLIMISEELAISVKTRVAWLNLAYLFLVTLVVATGIKVVGTLLVGALVIVPAVAARNISPTLARYSMLSTLLGAVSSCTGVLLSNYSSLPVGPLVVIVGVGIFLATLLASRVHLRWTTSDIRPETPASPR